MRFLLSICFFLFSSAAFAHVGVGETSGFVHGFGHPLGGLDHILAMVAVGIFAANLGGRAIWAVPLTFMALMGVGGMLGISGVQVPFVELGIALSIVILGLAVAIKWEWPLAAAMAFVGLFAIFHGHAHGTEMPLDASGAEYAAGFIIATGLLHLAGIGTGYGISLWQKQFSHGRRVAQVSGGIISVLGVGVLAGVI